MTEPQSRSNMKIHIKNNSVYPQRIFAFGRGSYGFDLLEFVFSSDWKGLNKKIVFVAPDGEQISVKHKGETVTVPRKILSSRGKCLIFAVGEGGGLAKTSVPIELWVAGDHPEDSGEV